MSLVAAIRRLPRRAPGLVSRVGLALAALAAPVVAGPLAAQPAEGDGVAAGRFAALAAAARAVLARDAGALWSARLDTIPWLAVAGGRAYATADPGAPGFARQGALWAGPLPDGVNPANTSLDWAGRRWAMVLLPLPADSAAAVRLLLHEAMHVAQPAALPSPPYAEGGAGATQLDEPEGRLWLQLEWRALADALDADPGSAAEARAAGDALLFRARRLLAADSAERVRQGALDVGEGLPEYTAWALTAGPAAAGEVARAIRDRAPALPSFERGFPYFTGPAYALLLDRRAPSWRARVAARPDLQRALAETLADAPPAVRRVLDGGATPAPAADAVRALAAAAGDRYGAAALRAREDVRWAERERRLAGLRARFVDGATLRVRPSGGLRITFDPTGQSSMGAAGTVMANVVWKGDGGAELRAPAGALVTADWQELRVPLGDAELRPGALGARTEWHGAGWTLVLPAGWTVEEAGASRVVRPPRP